MRSCLLFCRIKNPKTDKRIQFIGGIRGLSELERLVDAQGGAAFALYPTSMEELFRAADQGRLMPPKSTWFEPKLRSGSVSAHDFIMVFSSSTACAIIGLLQSGK